MLVIKVTVAEVLRMVETEGALTVSGTPVLKLRYGAVSGDGSVVRLLFPSVELNEK